jgi:hypothetical protein
MQYLRGGLPIAVKFFFLKKIICDEIDRATYNIKDTDFLSDEVVIVMFAMFSVCRHC